MRDAAERTVETTWRRLGALLLAFPPIEPLAFPPIESNAQTTSQTQDMLPCEYKTL
jgi:hypothetical protein